MRHDHNTPPPRRAKAKRIAPNGQVSVGVEAAGRDVRIEHFEDCIVLRYVDGDAPEGDAMDDGVERDELVEIDRRILGLGRERNKILRKRRQGIYANENFVRSLEYLESVAHAEANGLPIPEEPPGIVWGSVDDGEPVSDDDAEPAPRT